MSLGYASDFMKKSTVNCERCGLKYPKENDNCSHCFHLTSERELQTLKTQLRENDKSFNKIRLIFVVLILMISFLLYLSV